MIYKYSYLGFVNKLVTGGATFADSNPRPAVEPQLFDPQDEWFGDLAVTTNHQPSPRNADINPYMFDCLYPIHVQFIHVIPLKAEFCDG